MACTDVPDLPIALPGDTPACCAPTTVAISFQYQRTTALSPCEAGGYTTPYLCTGLLTLAGAVYSGTFPGLFSDAGDLHHISVSLVGGVWKFTGQLLPSGCGVGNAIGQSSAAALLSTYPVANGAAAGSCGCATQLVRYFDIVVS
jgi:hypothetical protein